MNYSLALADSDLALTATATQNIQTSIWSQPVISIPFGPTTGNPTDALPSNSHGAATKSALAKEAASMKISQSLSSKSKMANVNCRNSTCSLEASPAKIIRSRSPQVLHLALKVKKACFGGASTPFLKCATRSMYFLRTSTDF